MAVKGGYQILDLKGKNLRVGQSYSVTIEGLYEALEGNYHKPTLIENLVVNGVERTSRFVVFGIDGQNYTGSIAISGDVMVLIMTITPDDVVTLVEK